MSIKHTTTSLLGTVTVAADAISSTVAIIGTYSQGWSERMKLAEDTRLMEAKLEHKAEQVLIPQRIALSASNELNVIHSKVSNSETFNEMLSKLNQ